VKYTRDYENSLHFSPHFQQYAESLVRELTERHRLHGKTIVEIGCGKGEFLKMICRFGGNRGIGFDPGCEGSEPAERGEDLTFISDVYSERYAGYKADLLCCRQVLEHVASPLEFLAMVRRALGHSGHATLFFEVPNVLFILRDLSIWDIIYEHFSYFSLSSLARLFVSCGFTVGRLFNSYEDQFLCVEASNRKPRSPSVCGDRRDYKDVFLGVTSFPEKYRRKTETWRTLIDNIGKAGQRAVVWGAGSKGITFLNTFNHDSRIDYVVDINPQKHGRYIAGTGQQVVSPDFLRTYRPDMIIVMNSIYRREIQQHTEGLGLRPEFHFA